MVIKIVVIYMCDGKSLDLISLHIIFSCNYLLNKLNCLLKPLVSSFLLDSRRSIRLFDSATKIYTNLLLDKMLDKMCFSVQ